MMIGAKIPIAPADAYVSDDVGAGYAAYRDVLGRWGDFSPDEAYGVHWCPRAGAAFTPYRMRGRWATRDDAPVYGAPPGSPFWVSDDRETWGEITMHHGFWVHLANEGRWCWIPGLEETPGRVVWRTGAGFVGWAPEPPTWIDDGSEGLYAFFEWSYALEGGLFEQDLEEQLLDGDARDAAASATAHPTGTVSHFARLGPKASEVQAAKKELVAYAANHPEARPKKAESNALPRGMAMYPILVREPVFGPLPRVFRSAEPARIQASPMANTSAGSSTSQSTGHTSSAHSTSHASVPSASHTQVHARGRQ